MAEAPDYWMYETTGVLRPAVEAYLNGAPLSPQQGAALHAYLRQWIVAPAWCGPGIEELRAGIARLTDRATRAGIDPL